MLIINIQRTEYDDPIEIVRMARLAVKEANMRATRMQGQTTQQLMQRVKDLKYWSGEIDRELADVKEEHDDLLRCYRRLQLCLDITGRASRCNESCLAVRRKKVQVGDHTSDRVDMELHKEKELMSETVKQMKEVGERVERQLEMNQAARKNLLRDLTLKQEAISLDHKSVAIGADGSKTVVRTPDGDRLDFREGAPLQRMSEYSEWIENTGNNLNYAARARVHSRKIGQKLCQSLREMASQLRTEAIAVEALLKDSVRNWQEWKDNLHSQVNAKDKEIKNADGAIDEISFSLKQKSGPLQVALSRQNQRGLRPGIELCNDKAQHALHQELMMLKGTFLSLENQLDKAKESRKKLENDRDKLQRKLDICDHNLTIDNEILRQIRSSYPHEIQLSGFLLSETKEHR
ncbi:hypothetical protein CAEBREN_23666 [Caenorhabditis brenneri]|uniref:Tektin n=1 Tax=Caenorhabditis brenneri TaxID=135651 RepID=G0M7W0_CAEBE|nr:hypothetical protein CAEBREN_23666 [Caenorhabditis brenneri]